jgi:hypothetical protein
VRPASGIPCALLFVRGVCLAKLGQNPAARMLDHVFRCHSLRMRGIQYPRGLSVQSQPPLEYWLVRSSRTTTPRCCLTFESETNSLVVLDKRAPSERDPGPITIGVSVAIIADHSASRWIPRYGSWLSPGRRPHWSPRRWRNRHFVATLRLRGCVARQEPTYPRGLIDPLGNCPWPGPWIRTYGAHLLS